MFYYRKNGQLTTEVVAVKHGLKRLQATYGDTLASDFGTIRFELFRQTFVDKGLGVS